MIVIYKREWATVRAEDIKSIHIFELEKAENYSRRIVEVLKQIYPDVEKENVLFKDLVFDNIKRQYNLIISDAMYRQAGYQYIIIVDSLYGGFTFPIKKLGNPDAVQVLLDGSKEIKYVKISEEEGIVEVKLKE
ncbi:MAG TPA: hypothetical protein EYH22_01605 [Candidatus Nanopusillus sp.]|nr:hypothetical protein [Candidatus Nanopusillus sp.]